MKRRTEENCTSLVRARCDIAGKRRILTDEIRKYVMGIGSVRNLLPVRYVLTFDTKALRIFTLYIAVGYYTLSCCSAAPAAATHSLHGKGTDDFSLSLSLSFLLSRWSRDARKTYMPGSTLGIPLPSGQSQQNVLSSFCTPWHCFRLGYSLSFISIGNYAPRSQNEKETKTCTNISTIPAESFHLHKHKKIM